MTEPSPPPELDPADLAASAALDGEPLDPTVEAPATSDVGARIEVFRSIQQSLGAPVAPPSDEVRDGQIAGALAAVGASASRSGSTAPEAATAAAVSTAVSTAVPVGDLGAARAARRRATRRWLAVAAAVIAAAVAVPLVARLASEGGSQDVASTTAASGSAAAPQGATDAPSGPTGSAAPGTETATTRAPTPSDTSPGITAPTSTLPSGEHDLGRVASTDELAARVLLYAPDLAGVGGSTTTLVGSTTTSEPPTSIAPRALSVCDTAVRSDQPDLGDPVYVAVAQLAEQSVEVLVYRVDPTPSYRLFAAELETCSVVGTIDL